MQMDIALLNFNLTHSPVRDLGRCDLEVRGVLLHFYGESFMYANM